MRFQDFLAHAESAFRKAPSGSDWIFGPLGDSQIFFLGDDQEFMKAINDIRPDLYPEMQDGIRLPFKDLSTVSVVEGKYILDRIREIPEGHPLEELIKGGIPQEGQEDAISRVKQFFSVARFCERLCADDPNPAVAWHFGYIGVNEEGHVFGVYLEAEPMISKETATILTQIAAISHPANYVVKVTPELSPREARRMATGKPRPPAKAVHFIVVDHEVLISMRSGPSGTHASPIPHERRGHWRRLAEHCRHARLLGKDKIWVHPAFVGDPKFSDHKHHYEVLLDFGSKEAEVHQGADR